MRSGYQTLPYHADGAAFVQQSRWQAYISEKLTAALTRRAGFSLFALAFIAVYREVFETVLFYSALAVDGNSGALMAGFLICAGAASDYRVGATADQCAHADR